MGDTQWLSGMDVALLHAERPPVNMNIGGLLIFDHIDATPEQAMRHIESRLHRLPRFRQRVMEPPLGMGRPAWVDDEHFDISYHVRNVGLGGTRDEAALFELFGRLMSIPLDRSRPLWEIWIVDLPDGRYGVIQKAHHAMIDGVSDAEILVALLDLSPDYTPEEPREWEPAAPPSQAEHLFRAAQRGVGNLVAAGRGAAEAARDPRPLAGRAAGAVRALTASMGAVGRPAPATSLSGEIGTRRRFEVVRASLEDVKDAKNRHGTTVNDVALAAVACGLGQLLRDRGESTDGLRLESVVPVSIRPAEAYGDMGNRFTPLLVELPVGEEDPVRCLVDVHEQMQRLKASKALAGSDSLLDLTEYVPSAVIALGVRSIIANQRVMNLMVTNVPGPQFPLYFMGSELLEIFPFVSLLQHTTIGVAIASYNGQIAFGLSGDWDSTPDMSVLAEGIAKAIAAL